jgi:hypothetical protein
MERRGGAVECLVGLIPVTYGQIFVSLLAVMTLGR